MLLQQQVSNYCTFMGQIFQAVATLRDKGIPPHAVVRSMLESELPDEVKQEAGNIVELVYSVPQLSPEEIGPVIYGQCMQQITGLRRNT